METSIDEQIAWVEREINFLEEEWDDDKSDDVDILKGILKSLNVLDKIIT